LIELGHARIDHERVGTLADQRDRREIADRMKRQLRIQAVIDGVRADRRHHDRITVGRAFRGQFSRDIAAGASAIVDHERLTELVAQRRFHRARDDVRRAARRKRNENADRARRVLLRRRRTRSENEHEQNQKAQQPHHVLLLTTMPKA
jgi:hypothetical protein